MFKKILKNSERGQAIIIIAFAFIGLIAIVGLLVDGGMMLIEYARLKRGIDAASIAAAQQFRRGFVAKDMENAARNFLILNQSDVVDIHIQTCDYPDTEHDLKLCEGTRSKLVRITASRQVNFGFMRILGFDHTTVRATSVGEAASIDLVLIMDTSLSMSFGTSGDPLAGNEAGDDPHACNLNKNCQPLENIKTVAREFIKTLFFPYDRVAIVTMTDQAINGTRTPTLTLPFKDDPVQIDAALAAIKVFEPPVCVVDPAIPGKWISPPKGVCLNYINGVYQGVEAPIARGGLDLDINTTDDNSGDFTTIPSSNVGGSFVQANAAFTGTGAPTREDAFWVVIALISGPANATNPVPGHPDGICPPSTWNAPNTPKCRDSDLDTDGVTPLITRHKNGSANYDADDYARDMADFIADPVKGNGIVIFTIGLGTKKGLPNSVKNSPIGLATSGENLLKYASENAGDTLDPITGNILTSANHGQYYYAEDPNLQLGPIFLAIANNIFTRISQ